jgi:hypothetical protein
VSISGIEQCVAIQGRDVNNRSWSYLHGAPAQAQSPSVSQFLP